MQNSILFRRSSFFIDAMNVFFYTDLFLYHELVERMKEDILLKTLFSDKLPVFNTDNRVELDRLVIKSTATKKHQNILCDWVNHNKYIQPQTGENINTMLANLYMDMLVNPVCNEYMQVTELGNTIRLVVNDRQVNKIHIYIPFDSLFVRQMIFNALNGNTSVSIIIGGKENFLKKNFYDSYMFENIDDVDKCLAIESNKNPNSQLLKEVLIPTYDFNLEESRTDLDILLEQVTYHKMKLSKSSNEYTSDYKLSINTIHVPL